MSRGTVRTRDGGSIGKRAPCRFIDAATRKWRGGVEESVFGGIAAVLASISHRARVITLHIIEKRLSRA